MSVLDNYSCEGQMSIFDFLSPDSSCGKTYQEPCQAQEKKAKERTSKQSSRKSSESLDKMLPMFLYLTGEDGQNRDASWVSEIMDNRFPSLGEYTMRSFGEFPSEGRESRLSQILEICPPQKYCLSARACQGILNRASKRGKELPIQLEQALKNQAQPTHLKLGGGREIDSLGHRAGKGALVQKEKSGTLGVSQDQTLIQTGSCIGFDAYNQISTGEVSKSLNSISTDSDHVPLVFKNEENVSCYRKTAHPRNPEEGQGWEETEVNDTLNIFDSGETRTSTLIAQGFDSYNLKETGEIGRTLTTPTGGLNEHIPVLLENRPQDSRVKISKDNICQTLDARMGMGGGNVPLVFDMLNMNPKKDDKCQTLNAYNGTGGNNMPLVMEEPMLLESSLQHASIRTDGISATLTARMGTGGGYVPMVTDEVAGTLDASYYKGCGERNGVEREVVVSQAWDGSQVSPTLTANNANGAQRMPDKDNFNAVIQNETYQNVTGSLMASGYDKLGTQEAMNDMYVSNKSIVRRLTPLECERLQGFPDGWTDIGDWTDSSGKKHKGDADSPRYKALGNSIALPFWQWMADRMVQVLHDEGIEEPSMASLFDGIGGFPLVYSRCGCQPIWASEIEEFPIAVTKLRFPEEEEDE